MCASGVHVLVNSDRLTGRGTLVLSLLLSCRLSEATKIGEGKFCQGVVELLSSIFYCVARCADCFLSSTPKACVPFATVSTIFFLILTVCGMCLDSWFVGILLSLWIEI